MRLLLVAMISVLFACSAPDGGNNDGGGGGSGGGAGGDGGAANPGVLVVDSTVTERLPLAMAVGPADRVGIAYFVKVGPSVTRPSVSDYALKYIEWQAGVLTQPQTVATVQRVYGLSLTFQNSGEPAVTYLGGGDDQSIFWFQSDAVIATRVGSTWSESLVAARGDEALCNNASCAAVSDRGFLVGLYPAVVNANGTLFLAWRDGHDGQFPQQDWAGSDLEIARGAVGSWNRSVVAPGGGDKKAWGGHPQLILGAGGQPAMVSDHVYGSADGFGTGVYFHKFDGVAWSTTAVRSEAEATNNQTGPSLAYRQQVGYGISFVNRNTDALQYVSSANGSSWSVPDVVFQNGSGGWYPSLAFDPLINEPSIAFYVCSLQSGITEGSCPEGQDDLRIATRGGGGQWNEQVIDSEGGYLPKLSFLSTNKRVLAYRHPTSFRVKLYIEP